jgi:oxygen-independent coproporphyrinogen-3 oxidase
VSRFAPANGKRRGVAILAHAMMARAAYQHGLATALAAEGILAYSFDFRGHGESERPRAWGFAELAERDVPAVVAAVAADAGCAPSQIAFLGHSLGGLAAVAAFGAGHAPPPRRLVLVSASPWTRRSAGRLLRMGITAALATLARPMGRLPVRALRLGSDDESAHYHGDFAGWVRRGAWPWLDGAAKLCCPALVVVGQRDPLCLPADARIIADRLGGEVTWLSAPGGHFGLFRGRRARTLWSVLVDFLA